MSIVIQKVLGETESGVRAIVDHDGTRLDVEVAATSAQAVAAVGQSLTVELGYAETISWDVVATGRDAHGLFQAGGESGAIRIVGDVHNAMLLDDGTSLFDVYVQSGPEFVTFPSTDLVGHPPKVGDCVTVTVRGLCFYPTWT